jgi:protein involved in polysaccharide export with SLBB domain
MAHFLRSTFGQLSLLAAFLVVSATAAAAGLTAEYQLRPMDQIEIRVFNEPDLSGRRLVGQDGTVPLSIVGSVSVSGLTQAQAAEKIVGVLKDGWLVNPRVEVNIAAFARRSVSVMGEVQRPGAVEIKPGQGLDLVQALALAGGASNRGNLRTIVVKRGSKIFECDAVRMATDASVSVFTLEADDVITVKARLF